ncbi:Diacylglycerol kinase [Teratosphaeriaceae sp. CCFEE 6253]|nr:Diacylglycerol kinase [Teratosphaeriaceae sp. CCFEE 6253]
MASQYQIPPTPRVISPSPTPSERGGKDGYFPSQARAAARQSSVEPIEEQDQGEEDGDSGYDDEDADPDLARARSRSRSPQLERKIPPRKLGSNGSVTTATIALPGSTKQRPPRSRQITSRAQPGKTNGASATSKQPATGLLSPNSAYGTRQGYGAAYWRSLSRSRSPLGLIPIHREWRAFIHKHEVPRKTLHVSIGFLALALYRAGVQPAQIHPVLLALLLPIFAVDLIRFRWPAFNRFYIRCLGPFMREAEAHDRFNGVIMYLAGLWATMFLCRKDVAVVSVLLLSWCDTAASTFGRMWGKYTPRIRRGKSLAGSLAAFAVGVGSAVFFWGWFAGAGDGGGRVNEGVNRFAFGGALASPWGRVEGWPAVVTLGVVTGLAASASEAVDLWGLDDNLTIPILCGLELGVFLWSFGSR